ncbi:replicative DNA helicase [Brevinema andersonii]|nr:replicative DNA helicase [Brevinema andersonii]
MNSVEKNILVSPHSVEAEQAVLGAALSNQRALYAITESLVESDFYDPAHQSILRTVVMLESKSRPVDIISVTDALTKSGELAKIGGHHILIDLVDRYASVANIEYHIKLVKDYALLRALISASREIIDLAMKREDDVETILDKADSLMFEVIGKRESSEYNRLSVYLKRALEMVDQRSAAGNSLMGIPTGYPDIDNLTNGLSKGSLIILAARAGMGKTAFALNIARKFLQTVPHDQDNKLGVLMFSLEMTGEEIAMRFLSAESLIPMDKINKAQLTVDEAESLLDAAGTLNPLNIIIDDTGNIALNTLRARARAVMRKFPYQLMIIDHIQIISLPGNTYNANRNNMLAQITGTLKALAKELGIPIIALSQLSRGVESRQDKTPQLMDLRESGSIEQDADIVAMLYREDYYRKDSQWPGIVELNFAKHRNGKTDMIPLRFFGETMRFESLDQNAQYAYKEYKKNQSESFKPFPQKKYNQDYSDPAF